MRTALSNNHWSFDNQVADVVSWLGRDDAEFQQEFPEYNSLTWEGAWVDHVASNVDPEYMSHVCDWIENNTLAYWEDGEPWIGSDELPE